MAFRIVCQDSEVDDTLNNVSHDYRLVAIVARTVPRVAFDGMPLGSNEVRELYFERWEKFNEQK